MEKPDPYGDWVLFPAKTSETNSAVPPDDQLISAAREAWPHVVAHAQKEFHQRSLGPDSTSLAAQIWEGVLRSVARARQRDRDHRPPIADLESYLIGAFHRRFNKALLREEKRLETIELVSSSVDLERIESGQDVSWVEELERTITIREITDRMDGWTKKVWQARQYGYSWKDISAFSGMNEPAAKKKFEYGLEKLRKRIVRLMRGAKAKNAG
jgi:DNA-directed RNA polymerase specialized sigma24 family protein